VRGFLARGGVLAFGAVPTSGEIADADADSVAARLEAAVGALASKGVPREAILRNSILTPSCGCGSRTLEETGKAFALLREVAGRWRGRLEESGPVR
jgi:hypothetical protein